MKSTTGCEAEAKLVLTALLKLSLFKHNVGMVEHLKDNHIRAYTCNVMLLLGQAGITSKVSIFV
jgi:hypothetical protein